MARRPGRVRRADVDQDAAGDAGEVPRLFLGNHHGGRSAGGKQDVGGDFLHDFVRETVYERASAAKKFEMAGGVGARKQGCGHFAKKGRSQKVPKAS